MRTFVIHTIVQPKNLQWLTKEKMEEYIIGCGWENEPNNIINDKIWHLYLTDEDYKKYCNIASPEVRTNLKNQIIELLKK